MKKLRYLYHAQVMTLYVDKLKYASLHIVLRLLLFIPLFISVILTVVFNNLVTYFYDLIIGVEQ